MEVPPRARACPGAAVASSGRQVAFSLLSLTILVLRAIRFSSFCYRGDRSGLLTFSFSEARPPFDFFSDSFSPDLSWLNSF